MELNNFNEAMFITKVNNIFIKYYSAIMLDELDTVKHFVSEQVYNEGKNIINNYKANGYRQMYDMLNVKDSKIRDIKENPDNFVITVYLESRYLDYQIDLDTGEFLSGNDKERIQVNYLLEFTRKKDTKEQSIARICPGCGNTIDVNNNGKCNYCGASYNQKDYDWVLTKITRI